MLTADQLVEGARFTMPRIHDMQIGELNPLVTVSHLDSEGHVWYRATRADDGTKVRTCMPVSDFLAMAGPERKELAERSGIIKVGSRESPRYVKVHTEGGEEPVLSLVRDLVNATQFPTKLCNDFRISRMEAIRKLSGGEPSATVPLPEQYVDHWNGRGDRRPAAPAWGSTTGPGHIANEGARPGRDPHDPYPNRKA